VKRHQLPLLTVVSLAVLLGASGLARADFLFLKNAKNDTAQASRDDLKNIYTGRTKAWKNGMEVTIILNAPGTPELKWLAEKVVGATEDVLVAKIKQEVFKGEMKKPEMAASADECLAALKKADGGVCVVDAEAAKALPAGVQVLKYTGG
jgi:hypothetical protein